MSEKRVERIGRACVECPQKDKRIAALEAEVARLRRMVDPEVHEALQKVWAQEACRAAIRLGLEAAAKAVQECTYPNTWDHVEACAEVVSMIRALRPEDIQEEADSD